MRRDLQLALRLIRGAGRRDIARLCVMAVGVAIALSALLVGLVAPRVSASAHDIKLSRMPHRTALPANYSGDGLQLLTSDETIGDRPWTRVAVSGASGNAPLPPGLSSWPAVGHSVVSPALAGLAAKSSLVRSELGQIDTIRIAPAGLVAPDELYSYTAVPGNAEPSTAQAASADGSDQSAETGGQYAVTSFGGDSRMPVDSGTSARLIFIEMLVLVILPALVFLSVCLRLSVASRAARSFALGLVGLSPSRSARVYGIEMVAVSAVGAAVALLAYPLVETRLGTSGLLGVRWWPAQAALGWPVRAACLIGTILTVWWLARRVMRSVARRTRSQVHGGDRRVGPVLGLVLVLPAVGGLLAIDLRGAFVATHEWASAGTALFIAACLAACLAGVILTAPAAVRWLGDQLSSRVTRSLRLGLRGATFNGRSSAKLIAFVSTVVMVGGLAAAFLASLERTALGDGDKADVQFAVSDVAATGAGWVSRLPDFPHVINASVGNDQNPVEIEIANCDAAVRAPSALSFDRSQCTESIQRGDGGQGGGGVSSLDVGGQHVDIPPGPIVHGVAWALKFPPKDAPWADKLKDGSVTYTVSKADGSYETLLADLHRAFPSVRIAAGLKDEPRYQVYVEQRGLIHAAMYLGLALSVGSFLLSAFESRWSRERSVAALAAIGAPRRALRWANVVQFCFPVLVAGVLAAVVGTVGGWALLSFYGTEGMFDRAVPMWTLAASALAIIVAGVTGWLSGGGRFRREALVDL